MTKTIRDYKTMQTRKAVGWMDGWIDILGGLLIDLNITTIKYVMYCQVVILQQ